MIYEHALSFALIVQSPAEIKSREVELGSDNRMVGLAAELFLDSCFSDTVFVTLLRTAVEPAISEVHKLLGTGGGPHLLNFVVLAVADDSLFCLYGSERADELFISSPPPPPFPPSLISRMVFVDVKHPLYLLCWFCPKSISLSLYCYALACEVNAAAALRAFCAEYTCAVLIGCSCSGD